MLFYPIKLSNPNPKMYNRYTHNVESEKLYQIIHLSKSQQKLELIRKASNEKMSEKYKERVRDFLVKITSKPIILGQYIPPVVNIIRNTEQDKILANAQLYINGFKTANERLDYIKQQNTVYDLSPTKNPIQMHNYRPRMIQSEIQQGMKFAINKTKSQTKFPTIVKTQSHIKLRFKGVEELGNNLKTLRPSQTDQIGLINKLQTVSGGQELDHLKFSMRALKQSKLITCKKNLYQQK